MKETNEKVYRCDHCNRAIVSKGSMTLHERMCKKNPNNQHQCFKYCKNLVKEQEEFNGNIIFHCTKKNMDLHSYKLERFKANANRLKYSIRMPLECDDYETDVGHDYSEPNSFEFVEMANSLKNN